MDFQPSAEQLKILESFNNSRDNLLINAVAGSGKTSTLRLIANQLDIEDQAKTLYLTFSKRMVADIKPKLPQSIEVRTFHSFGYQAIRRKYPGIQVNLDKYRILIQDYLRVNTGDRYNFHGLAVYQLQRLIEYIRLTRFVLGNSDPECLGDILDYLDFEFTGDYGDLASLIRSVIHAGVRDTDSVDLADQLFFPAIGMSSLPSFDTLLCDEVQDQNSCMLSIVNRMSEQNTRIVGVGDPLQAIFGFMGADLNSFNRVQKTLKVNQVHTLSTCYRCFDEILEYAKQYTSIQGTGKLGKINKIRDHELYKAVKPGDLVLCRKNAPLISIACELMSKKIPAQIEGRDFGKHLSDYVAKIEKMGYDFADFDLAIEELIKLKIKKSRNPEKKKMLLDTKDCLLLLCELDEVNSFSDLKGFISSLFSENSDNMPINWVRLSSIHKAKGLEADRVFWILLEPLARLEEQGPQSQEANLCYVALTRAKQEFTFVSEMNLALLEN